MGNSGKKGFYFFFKLFNIILGTPFPPLEKKKKIFFSKKWKKKKNSFNFWGDSPPLFGISKIKGETFGKKKKSFKKLIKKVF